MIAEKVLNGMLSTLGEMRNPAHPWRVELRKAVEKLIDDLATDPQMRARAEGIKAELLASPLVIEQAKTLWAEIETGLNSAFPAHSASIAQTCEHALRSIGGWLDEDGDRKARTQSPDPCRSPSNFCCFIVSRSAPISSASFAIGTPRRWSIGWKWQVGKDLQYIRINGTLVGGLVGLLIFIASKWIALF